MNPHSRRFHFASKNSVDTPHVKDADSAVWPKEWGTTYYKSYPRLKKIFLPISSGKGDLFSLLHKRRSRRIIAREPVSLDELSLLLTATCGERSISDSHIAQKRRSYPSAGARFPIEVYIFRFLGDSQLSSGMYHYSVSENALHVLWEHQFEDEEIGSIFVQKEIRPSFLLVCTAVFWRMQDKYGERGYRHILLEAGYIGQSVSLVSEVLGLSCVAVGGVRDTVIENLLDIDGVNESVVHTISIGK